MEAILEEVLPLWRSLSILLPNIMVKLCATCGIPASLKCSRCKQTNYCGVDHQRVAWPEHKKTCRASITPTASMPFFEGFLPEPTSWARGRSMDQAAEWFVDAFRLRMDDDQVWAAGEGHGSYFASTLDKTLDFLIFCKLTVAEKVVPQNFDWNVVLNKAADLLGYAFEKSDAVEKYGQAISLRMMAETAYKVYIMNLGSEGHHESYHVLDNAVRVPNLFNSPALFVDVGGIQPWLTFRQNFHPPGR